MDGLSQPTAGGPAADGGKRLRNKDPCLPFSERGGERDTQSHRGSVAVNNDAVSLIKMLRKRAEYYDKKKDRVKNILIKLGCLSKLHEIESLINLIEMHTKCGIVYSTIILEFVDEFIRRETP